MNYFGNKKVSYLEAPEMQFLFEKFLNSDVFVFIKQFADQKSWLLRIS